MSLGPRSAALTLAAVLSVAATGAASGGFDGELEFLGEAVIASGARFADTEVGGLSGIHYDPASERFVAVSDDPAATDAARLYTLSIDLSDGRLESDDVKIDGVVVLSDSSGRPFAPFSIDGEGIAPAPGGGLFISSEGNVERGVAPFVAEIGRDGGWRRALRLPRRYLPRKAGVGVRHNLAFEALSLSPSGRWLFAGLENALAQDGPAADLDRPSPVRILRFGAASGRPADEYLYWVDPVPLAPTDDDGFRVNGLVELLALDDEHLLALERCYAAGAGNSIRLFTVDLGPAERLGRRALGRRAARIRPAAKTLLADFSGLGIALDNLEGMTLGPTLPDGRRSLIVVGDNNFSPRQRTQILAFAWRPGPLSLPAVQGAAHRSPLEGRWLSGLTGIVTAVDPTERHRGFWVQDPEGDGVGATSDALFVAIDDPSRVAVGDAVRLAGRVAERGAATSLPVTTLEATDIAIVGRGLGLPAPVRLGPHLPASIAADSLARFAPDADALAHFESLEGMRVEVPEPLVVGPTSRFGDFVVAALGGRELGDRSQRGGLLARPDDPRPERIHIDTRLLAAAPGLAVGTRLAGPVVGVLDYAWGAYEVVAGEPLPAAIETRDLDDPTPLAAGATALTVATFNVENLDAGDSDEKFGRVARVIVTQLGSPDIVAVQEIQDDSGATDDGVVTAAATLTRLCREVELAGGPRYAFHQVDPADGADGGQPGANIRVAFLVNPERVAVPVRGAAGALAAAEIEAAPNGPRLVPNPARIDPADPAFASDDERGFEASRKPLALEVEVAGRRVFLVNLHLKSKRGDDPLFGPVQPPRRPSETQRRAQARVVHRFVARLLLADPQAAVVVLGDLNEHEFRAPVADLAGTLLVNLVPTLAPAERYTYVYRGLSQVLDHVLVSRALAATAAPEIDVVHVNADAPAGSRSSDHDPVLVRLELGGEPPRDVQGTGRPSDLY